MLDLAHRPEIQPAVPPDGANHLGCYGNRRQGWLAVQTHPQAERWANNNLQRSGFRSYLPLYATIRRDPVLRTLTRHVLVPLFNGYLFCWHDAREPRRPIRETPGVRDIVRCGSQTQWVPEGAVEALQAGEAVRLGVAPAGSPWAPGMPCRLRTGYVFEGLPAVVNEVGRETALIAIMMLGHLCQARVPLDALQPRGDS